MKAVLLDADTLGRWDENDSLPVSTDLRAMRDLPMEFVIYGQTNHEQRLERCRDADIIMTNKVIIDDELMAQCPNLKLIQLAATGMNNIDLNAAEQRSITCLNVADYSTFAVAQLTFQFILNFATRASDHYTLTQQGAWQNSRMFTLTDFPTMEVSGKTLVLLGYGNIAQKVEQLAQAFGMTVIRANIPGRPVRDQQIPLDDAIPQADFVSLHCPLTEETNALVNEQFLDLMKPSAFIINTARGPIIDEGALAQSLKSGAIAGAGLDVLSQEPPPADNPLLQADVPNIYMTPHIAWASKEAKDRLIKAMTSNVKQFLQEQAD